MAALATAGLIVASFYFFVNRASFDVGVRPLVQLDAVIPDSLLPDREFTDVGPNGAVKLCPAHAEVGGGLAGADEARGG
jgi:hypothetical protein